MKKEMSQAMNQNQQSQQGLEGSVKLNRKTTKIEFLSQENQQLREQIQELQNIVKLNKEALKIAMQSPSQQSDHISGSIHFNNNNESSFNKSQQQQNNNYFTNTDNPKALNQVLNSLFLENEALIKINEKITEERNYAQSKALINEQISEASQKHEKELIMDLEDKVMNLTMKVKEQEQIIYNYEKIRPDYDEISGIVIKYRDIISLNDQTVRLHDENERLNTIILKFTRENTGLKSDKQDLVKINMQMSNEILRLKAALAAPHGRTSYIQNSTLSGSQSFTTAPLQEGFKGGDIIKIHKKLMKNDNSDQEDEYDDDMGSEIDVLPDKAMTTYTEAGTQSTNPKALGLNIPKLDLAKALKIQEINAKKSTMQQLQKQQGSDIGAVCSQLKKVEGELTIAKKNLQREMLMNKTLSIENENLKRVNVELEQRNETLVSSHQMYEEKWQKIFQSYQYYKDYYKKNINNNNNNNNNNNSNNNINLMNQTSYQMQRSNRSQHNRDKSVLGIDYLNSSSYTTTVNRYITNNMITNQINTFNDSQLNVDPDKILTSKVFSRKDQNNNNNINTLKTQQHGIIGTEMPIRSILDLNNQDINLDDEICKIDPLSQKEYAKSYLMNIAKDVYGMFNKQQREVVSHNSNNNNHNSFSQKKRNTNVQQNQQKNEYKLKRSMSNPLDYMNEQGKEQNLDRSDIGVGRNYITNAQDQSDIHSSTQKYKELNDVINNQEILIQFTDQNNTEEKTSNTQQFSSAAKPAKPLQLND